MERRERLFGIALMCGALVCFTLLDATAKWLTQHLDTLQIVWARYASAFVLTFAVVNPWTVRGLLATARPALQLGRSSLLLLSTAFNFVALQELRLDQTVSIMFTTPFLVAAMAGPLLGEWIGWRRWVAIFVGFGGVLIVMRPGFGGIHWFAWLAFFGAFSYALYNIATRMLAGHDSTATTLFYSNLVGFVVATLPLPWVWTTPTEPRIIALLVLLGALGAFGHWLLILAHRRAPAGVLAPFIYTQIAWMVAAGYFVFGDLPDRWTLAGAAIVIGSGLYLLYRERVRGREAAASRSPDSDRPDRDR